MPFFWPFELGLVTRIPHFVCGRLSWGLELSITLCRVAP